MHRVRDTKIIRIKSSLELYCPASPRPIAVLYDFTQTVFLKPPHMKIHSKEKWLVCRYAPKKNLTHTHTHTHTRTHTHDRVWSGIKLFKPKLDTRPSGNSTSRNSWVIHLTVWILFIFKIWVFSLKLWGTLSNLSCLPLYYITRRLSNQSRNWLFRK